MRFITKTKSSLTIITSWLFPVLLMPSVSQGSEPITKQDDKQPKDKAQSEFSANVTLSTQQWQLRSFPTLSTCPIQKSQSLRPNSARPQNTSNSSVNESATRPEKGYRLGAEQAIEVNADVAHIAGDVRLESQQFAIAAGEIRLQRQSGAFSVTDQVLAETDTAIISAESAQGNADQGTAAFRQTRYLLKQTQVNGSADRIDIVDGKQLALSNLTFTTCPDANPDWLFSAETLALNTDEGWGEAEDLVVSVGDIPIFYFPWLTFPIDDRAHTGFLYPSFSNSDRNGFDVEIPFYWRIADNLDATINTRHLSKRGEQLGVELRYLTTNHAGTTGFEWLNDQWESDDATTDDMLPDTRWQYQLSHLTRIADDWTLSVDAAGTSDAQYFRDLGGRTSNQQRDQLTRKAVLAYHGEQVQANLHWLRFQPLALATEPYRQMPQLNVSWQVLPDSSHLDWRLLVQHTQFTNVNPQSSEATRRVFQSRFTYPFVEQWGYLKPSITWHRADYEQRQLQLGQIGDPSVSVATTSIDSGLIFERETQSVYQTLEPRLFLTHTPYKDQSTIGLYDTREYQENFAQLFTSNRFSGFDRVSDTQKATVALTSRWADATNRRTWMTLAVGQSFYHEPEQVTLNDTNAPPESPRKRSSLITQWSWLPSDHITVQSELGYDTERNETNYSQLSVFFEPKDNFIVNVSHRFRDSQSRFNEQSQLAMAIPISDSWRLMGNWHHDWTNKRSLETLVGVEYESCCWAIRIGSRRYLNARLDTNGGIIPDQQDPFTNDVFFQFIFKGMGSIGQRGLTDLLEENIRGYRDPYQ